MKAAIIINLILVLAVVNGSIFNKRNIINNGQTVYLKLAPVDPRSLMQGDYMILRQDLLRSNPSTMENTPTRGNIVLKLDAQKRGTFARPDNGSELNPNEVRLKYRRAKRGYQFGLESFFFAEGDAATYESAKYCEVKIDASGNAVLVDLLGDGLNKLTP